MISTISKKIELSHITKGFRLWIHVLERKLSVEESNYTDMSLANFINSWESHGTLLKANYWWVLDRVLLIGVNESYCDVGGCSMDSKTHFIQDLESKLNLSFGDNSKFYALKEQELKAFNRKEFKIALSQGNLNRDSIVLNTLCPNTDNIETELLPQIRNSWHKNFLD